MRSRESPTSLTARVSARTLHCSSRSQYASRGRADRRAQVRAARCWRRWTCCRAMRRITAALFAAALTMRFVDEEEGRALNRSTAARTTRPTC